MFKKKDTTTEQTKLPKSLGGSQSTFGVLSVLNISFVLFRFDSPLKLCGVFYYIEFEIDMDIICLDYIH